MTANFINCPSKNLKRRSVEGELSDRVSGIEEIKSSATFEPNAFKINWLNSEIAAESITASLKEFLKYLFQRRRKIFTNVIKSIKIKKLLIQVLGTGRKVNGKNYQANKCHHAF